MKYLIEYKEGSDNKIRSFYVSQKHNGLEISDAVLLTSKKFKKSEEDIRNICDDILDEDEKK